MSEEGGVNLASEGDLATPQPRENGFTKSNQEKLEEILGSDEDDDDIRDGETREEALQRRIEEGKIGKGKTLRRWKNTEEKQRMVETWRHQSKVQRYGQIYEEVRALRQETRHSVQDLRERFKEKGIIQNKDQFIVKLIAQERNEHEGKVAAIKSLQQWRLTDVELHNFINRCHKKGIAGKLDLAMQWADEQEKAGGRVNFKEGLAFYSSIGILQPRSSAHTQQQWREWREWEDALTCAIEKHNSRGADGTVDVHGADAAAAAEGSSNEDSTVCNSPWSSERGGGGGSFPGFCAGLSASSAHGAGDRRFRSHSGTAPETGSAPERSSRGGLPRYWRGRTPSQLDASDSSTRVLSWRSYSPPSSLLRQKRFSGEGVVKKSNAPTLGFGRPSGGIPGGADGGAVAVGNNGKPPPSPGGAVFSPHGAMGGGGKLGESAGRANGGGDLPPRHPPISSQLSPASHRGTSGSDSGEVGTGGYPREADPSGSEEAETPTLDAAPSRPDLTKSGAARTAAEGPAVAPPEKRRASDAGEEQQGAPTEDPQGGSAPAEGEPPGARAGSPRRKPKRGDRGGDGDGDGGHRGGRPRSLSGVLSGLAEWLMPGMDGRHSHRRSLSAEKTELIMEVYPGASLSPVLPPPPVATRSAPATPRGRRRQSAVLRDGGWFYNGDSDYSTEEDMDASYESEDEGFWEDAGSKKPPKKIGGGGGVTILSRLKRLFTLQ